MDKKGLTVTVAMKAQSANFGEGLGNVSTLKKLIADDGLPHTYISRQALRYNLMHNIEYDNTPVAIDKKVAQFDPNATIESYPEIDLFGYMKTKKGLGAVTRSAVVRLSHAISTQPFYDDIDFLTNLSLASRLDDPTKGLMPSQSEMHQSLYVYTLTVDLDLVGIDENDDIHIDSEEKARRIKKLLESVHHLYRDIKGRREDLQPLLIVGGIFNTKSPVFSNALDIKDKVVNTEKLTDYINDVQAQPAMGEPLLGLRRGEFLNESELTSLNPDTIINVIDKLKQQVDDYYASN